MKTESAAWPPQTPPRTLVFIGGLHRSGTTPLARLMGGHHQVSAFHGTGAKEDEGQHLQDVYLPARTHGGAGRFAFSPAAHLTEDSPLVSPDTADRLFGSWAPHWDLERPYLVEKSPPNLLMTRFLQALFPTSRIVVIVRHPVIVALSTHKWTEPQVPLTRLIEHWVHAHELFAADAGHLRAVHVLKYEHLVTRPDSTLAEVADFLGLEGQIPTTGLQQGRSCRYRREWDELRESRRPLRRFGMRRLRDRLQERVMRLGYDLDDLDVAEPFSQLNPPRRSQA